MKKNDFKLFGVVFVMIAVCLLSFPASGIAGDENGCSLVGSWYAAGSIEWLVTYQGQSNSNGTSDLEYPSFDATLGGTFPNAVTMTSGRGAWVRTGGNTFAFTVISLAIDANGTTEWIAKLRGTNTLMDSCDTEYIENTLEVFAPNSDPFEDEPLFAITALPGHYGYRMRVDPSP